MHVETNGSTLDEPLYILYLINKIQHVGNTQ